MSIIFRKKHITWDEKTIAEHDKERGTRMVVNEPKTPYNRLGLPESNYLLDFKLISRSR